MDINKYKHLIAKYLLKRGFRFELYHLYYNYNNSGLYFNCTGTFPAVYLEVSSDQECIMFRNIQHYGSINDIFYDIELEIEMFNTYGTY